MWRGCTWIKAWIRKKGKKGGNSLERKLRGCGQDWRIEALLLKLRNSNFTKRKTKRAQGGGRRNKKVEEKKDFFKIFLLSN